MARYAITALALLCGTVVPGGCDLVETRPAPGEVTFTVESAILLADLAGGEPARISILAEQEGSGDLATVVPHAYAWSPDGRTIAVAGQVGFEGCRSTWCPERHLHTYDVASGEVRRLQSVGGSVYAVDWSAAGNRLLVAVAPSGAHSDASRMRLLLVDPVNDVADTLAFEPRNFKQIRWSPQGSAFAAVELVGLPYEEALRLMSVDGSESERIVSSTHVRVDWSPAGDRLLVADGHTPSTLYSLHVASGMRADVTLPRPMQFIEEARWSPDGRSILFAGTIHPAANPFRTTIYVLPEGEPMLNLGEGQRPAWRPRR